MIHHETGLSIHLGLLKLTNTNRKKSSIFLVPPRISPFNFEKDITEGLRTQLMCSSSQGDQPFNITWLKDQRIIYTRNSNKQHIDGLAGGDSEFNMWKANDPSSQYYIDHTIHINEYAAFSSILSIENLTSNHNGNYTCRISNQGGTVDHTTVLSVAGSYTHALFKQHSHSLSHTHTIIYLFRFAPSSWI